MYIHLLLAAAIFCSFTNVHTTPVLRQPNLSPFLYNATPVSIKRYAHRRKLVCPYAYSYYTRRTFIFYQMYHSHLHILYFIIVFPGTLASDLWVAVYTDYFLYLNNLILTQSHVKYCLGDGFVRHT